MSQLLSPFKMGSLNLANRVVMAPLTRGRAGTSRLANEYIAEYYAERASAGLLISEATAVSEQGYGWYATPGLYTEEQAKAWKIVTDAVHAKNGVIFAQLWHMGRQAHSSFNSKGEIVAPSAIKIPGDGHVRDINQQESAYETPRALETDEIAGVVKDYQNSARLAKEAGFDGVEVHGANGYLIDEFLQSSTNHRTDRYGGSIENRARFLLEIVDAVKEVFSSDRIGVRLSPNGVFGGMGSADNFATFTHVAKALSSHGLAYLHVMDGMNFGFHNMDKLVTLYDIKKNFDGPVIGNITYTKDTAEGAVRSGAADLIAFGRPYITNPDLVERFANNWPLAPDSPMSQWYGRTPDAKDSLEGYLGFPAYKA
jgi:N-ethylmaleimide reductase